jgi:D-3-phosphoglycerate dehydrogenase
MSNRIVITAAALTQGNNPVLESLREKGYEPIVHRGTGPPSREALREYLAGAVGMIAGMEPIDAPVLDAAPDLRVISRFGVGYDNNDLEAATQRGIVVTYVPDAMVDAVADLTMGLLLSVARRIPEMDRAVKAGEWTRLLGVDVARRTLGIVGTGRIGMAVAERARGFRMRLLGCDTVPNAAFVETLGGDYVGLEELLQAADFVTLHLPLTPETHHAIGAEQLAQMKPTACLINAARGSLVDTVALEAALREGRLRGAALDVYEQEPPGALPLLALPNVVSTPHVASFTDGAITRMARAALGNLMAVLNGERPEHVLNPELFTSLGEARR